MALNAALTLIALGSLLPLSAGAQSTLTPPNRVRAAHPGVSLAVSSHPAADSAIAKPTAVGADAGFNAHVALWRSFDVPAGVNGTSPAAINDLGEIAGEYTDSSGNTHGFLRKVGGEIVTFDAPNAVGVTYPNDLNNEGDIVGFYTDAKGATHGFIRSARGRYTSFDDPNSTSSPPATFAQAINDWGEVVGYWNDSNGNPHGFVRHVDGSLTPVEPPGALLSQAYHINDRGEVGGDWTDAATGISHGMLLRPDGKLVTFEAPRGITNTFGGLGQALNLEGSFAGTYTDANYGAHGYVRYANGTFAEFTAPRAATSNYNGTWSDSINLQGTVVGYSNESNGTTVDGYVRFADGTLTLANAPVAGSQLTVAWAINDLNEFTGWWNDANGAQHGFVALAVP